MSEDGVSEIYFACSIRGGRDDAEIYKQLVDHTKTEAKVLSELFADGTLTAHGMDKSSPEIWATDLGWVRQADGVIAEVTNPSLGVGYEIAKAEEWGKPILALYRSSPERRLSAMIDGSPGVEVVNYEDLEQAYVAINGFVRKLDEKRWGPLR